MKKIGIDIGGMSIKSGLVDENMNIIHSYNIPTEVEKGFGVTSQNIINMIYDLLSQANCAIDDIDAIGIGIPGVADENGKVHYATNLFWTNVDLGGVLRDEFKNIKISIDNDATIACVAEHKLGSIMNVKNAIMLTLGTGVGGGIIINGMRYSGNLGIGSEIGHMIVGENYYNCSCGNNGCLETFCSASAVLSYARKLVAETEEDTVLKSVRPGSITAKMVFEAAVEGDEISKKVVDRFIHYLSVGIANLINIFSPEVIVIGGGLAGAYDSYIDRLYEEVKTKIIFKNLPFAKIVPAMLGNDAGIIGAAML